GALSLGGQTEIGRLAAGMRADIVLLNLYTLNFTPRNDIRNHLVYCENGESVESVMIDGSFVVQNGHTTRVDEDALLAELRARLPRFLDEYAQVEKANERFEPYFAEIYRRCTHEISEMNRYSSDPTEWSDA